MDGPALVREAFPWTVRLVARARLREAVLQPLAGNDDELALLAEIEGATSRGCRAPYGKHLGFNSYPRVRETWGRG